MNLENSILKSLGTVLFDHSHMFYYILRLITNKIIIKKNLPHSKITFIKLLSRFKLYLYANSQLRIKRTVPVDFFYISHSPINDPTRTAAALPVIFALSRSGFTSTNSALTSFSDLAISSNA